MQKRQFLGFIEDFYGGFLHGDPRAEVEKPTETANVRALQNNYRLLLQGVESGDYGPFAASFAEDVTFFHRALGDHPFEAGLCGRDEVVEHIRANNEMVRDRMLEVSNVIAQGAQVVLAFRETGWLIPSDRKYDCELVQITTFRDGLVAKFQMYGTLTPIDTP